MNVSNIFVILFLNYFFMFIIQMCKIYDLIRQNGRVRQPPAAAGPQEKPHQRRARLDLAGAFFKYINYLVNLQTILNSAFVYIPQCLLTVK